MGNNISGISFEEAVKGFKSIRFINICSKFFAALDLSCDRGSLRTGAAIMRIVKQSFPRQACQSNEEYSDLVRQKYQAYCMWAKE